jgi:DNA-directed RNA polymerase subunit M/transcription elongation factor TFIIS
LTSLKFKHSGEPVLTLEDRYFVYEVVNMLNELNYEQVYNFLSTDWETVFGSMHNIRRKIIFDNPLMAPARDKFQLDMEIFRTRVDVTKGAVDCRKCGSEETISMEKQTRSADEPTSVYVFCTQCKHKWRAQ